MVLKAEQAAQTEDCIQLQFLKGSGKSCQRGLACLLALWATPFQNNVLYFKGCWMISALSPPTPSRSYLHSFTFAVQENCCMILEIQLRMDLLEVVVMLNNPPSLFFFLNPDLKETMLCYYGLKYRRI